MLVFYLSLIDDEPSRRDFERIYCTYRKQMLLVARSILTNNADAEDVVHDVFVKIASKYMPTIKGIQNEEDLRNYLLKATKNTALNLCKTQKKNNVSADDMIPFYSDTITDDQFLDLICTNLEYEKTIEAIKKLDVKYREVLYYHFVIGLSAHEVAKILGRKNGTVKMQLVRGKKILLSLLNIKGEFENGYE